jgi:hypothetical protein
VLISAWLFGISGAVLAGIGGFFIFLRPALLPEDLRYLGRAAGDIDELVPQMHRWLRLVFVALGGHAIAAGILTMYLAATAVRDGHATAVIALAFAGAVSTGLMAAVNFTLKSDFRWMLLAAASLWLAATGAAVSDSVF